MEFIETALENNIVAELRAEDNACIQERIARSVGWIRLAASATNPLVDSLSGRVC